ncbi:MAG TPA: universal stress protein, partial [Pyrinomonadaceae bacterium]|nr:universal stress protein [Pyrinomonadaceae bacterium]
AHARARILSDFPNWQVQTRVLEGSPARELLRQADVWRPDLIVVGSQGRSALGRLLLGSVSKVLATSALCSVRVGRRGAVRDEGAPVRLVVGVDGSPGARWAVRALGVRAWPEGTEVRLVVVDDGRGPARAADGRPRLEDLLTGRNEGVPVNARLMAEGARVVLAEAGLRASVEIREGDPRRVLSEEALAWAADAIFVGSNGLDHLDEKSGLGTVSEALVTGAACSVEVVR